MTAAPDSMIKPAEAMVAAEGCGQEATRTEASRDPIQVTHRRAGQTAGAKQYAKRALKRIRASQPFNRIATSALSTAFAVSGTRSEFAVKHLPRVGHVRSKLPNGRSVRLWSRGDDWVSNQVFWRGWDGYEPETIPLFFRLATKARVTLDVGAFVGYYALLAAHANPDGRVFAFEPLDDAYGRLLRNVTLNKLKNIHCIKAAVGDREGTAEFFHASTWMPCSSSLSYEFMRAIPGVKSSTVQVITLDGFRKLNSLSAVDLVKLDTETTESHVLQGMIETLRRDSPFIICEVLGRGSEELLEQTLLPFGYRFYHLTPGGPVLRDKIAGHPEWLNYLFTPLGPDEVARL